MGVGVQLLPSRFDHINFQIPVGKKFYLYIHWPLNTQCHLITRLELTANVELNSL